MRQLLDENIEIFVYQHPIDMRKSYDGLFQLVKSEGIFNGGLFLFFAKNRKRAKALLWNGCGLMIFMIRMEYGSLADISRRKSIDREELLKFFEGAKDIRKVDPQWKKNIANSYTLGHSSNRYERTEAI